MNKTTQPASLSSPEEMGAGTTTPDSSHAQPFEAHRQARIMSGLEPYVGTWDEYTAAHLLRRCLFGPKRNEIAGATQLGLSETLDYLFDERPMPDPPLNFGRDDDPDVAIGETWVDAPRTYDGSLNFYRKKSLRAWWIGLMINQEFSLREKMTLFWHNHFATEMQVVNIPQYMYKHLTYLRENCFGNFKQMAKDMTIDPAMLRYLNGNQNKKGKPNENYARELFELFTIGKGPTLEEGNYTHYTEQDVLAASEVLTGWRDKGFKPEHTEITAYFTPGRHENKPKQFSPAFNNYVIPTTSNSKEEEYQELVDMIFAQRETARYISRKLYRWFVYYVIDDTTEANVIEPMAQILIDNDFEIEPVLRALLGSAHFYDMHNRGCLIKNPMDHMITIMRQFEVDTREADRNLLAQYNIWYAFYQYGNILQMTVLDPPSVAGWSAYYQIPQFHEIWINSASLPARKTIQDALLSGFKRNGVQVKISPFVVLERIGNPSDPNALIEELAILLYTHPISKQERDFYKDALIPGLPDFEWTIEYTDFLSDPDNNAKRNAVETKLVILLFVMLGMAEYQLS